MLNALSATEDQIAQRTLTKEVCIINPQISEQLDILTVLFIRS